MATTDQHTISDAELLQQMQAGSAGAFEKIYRRHWRRLLAIAWSHINDKIAAEEAVQEVFASLWIRREKLSIDTLSGYLATAVKFGIFRQLLQTNRRRELLDQHYSPDTEVYADDWIHARFLEEYLMGEVERLPEKCRLVFIYSRQQGMTIPQIADKMDISVKTAEAHLTKALSRLRQSLDKVYFLLFL